MGSSSDSGNQSSSYIYIAHLVPAMKNVNVNFVVLEVGPPRRTTQGHDVRMVKVADRTGSINLSAWDDLGDFVSPGDIYRLRNGTTSVFKGCMSLSCGKFGELVKTGEFFMTYMETPNMSEFSAEYAVKYAYQKKGSPDEEVGAASASSSVTSPAAGGALASGGARLPLPAPPRRPGPPGGGAGPGQRRDHGSRLGGPS